MKGPKGFTIRHASGDDAAGLISAILDPGLFDSFSMVQNGGLHSKQIVLPFIFRRLRKEGDAVRRALVLAVALLLSVSSFGLLKKPVALPFKTNDDGMAIVPITIARGVEAHVIVDSAAGLDVFAPSLIQKAGGKPAGQFSGFRATGERIDVPLFTVPEIRIGPLVRKNALVGGWDVMDKLHIDGVISMSDFRYQPFTFDFPNQRIVFESENSLAERSRAGVSAPLSSDDYRDIALDLFGEFTFGGQRGQCSLDTGSSSSIISIRYMARLGIDENGKGVLKKVRKNIAGVNTTSYDTSIADIELAVDPKTRQAGPRVEFADIIYDCVVGIDFWAGRRLTIDIPHQRLVVSITAQ